MHIEPFFDKDTATFTYVVSDPASGACAVIDAVLDYDPVSGKVATHNADKVAEYIRQQHLSLQWILETHAHADHLSGAHYLKRILGGTIAIGEHIRDVLAYWVPLFNADAPVDGSQFDRLLRDGEIFAIGSLQVKVLYTPGHTPGCVCYQIGDAVFIGDTLLMPYVGTARTDFPGGSAQTLYRSIRTLYALPPATRLFIGHDYPPPGKEAACVATVAEQMQTNCLLKGNTTEADFIAARNARDKGKTVPRLLFPALQVNIRAGKLPGAEHNGTRYLRIPLTGTTV